MISAGMLAALALQACSTPPPPPVVSTTRIYAHDMEGKAPLCTAPSGLSPVSGRENPVAIVTGGNGWCGIPVRASTGRPFTAGLLTDAPHNGKVYVHTVGDDTRIDYIAKAGPVVPDSFAVRLIPGDAVVRVTVTPASAVTPVSTAPGAPKVGK
jgi:hypothetical protein